MTSHFNNNKVKTSLELIRSASHLYHLPKPFDFGQQQQQEEATFEAGANFNWPTSAEAEIQGIHNASQHADQLPGEQVPPGGEVDQAFAQGDEKVIPKSRKPRTPRFRQQNLDTKLSLSREDIEANRRDYSKMASFVFICSGLCSRLRKTRCWACQVLEEQRRRIAETQNGADRDFARDLIYGPPEKYGKCLHDSA